MVTANTWAQQVDLRVLVEAGLGRRATVVEWGCGVGEFARLLSRFVGPEGRVIGVDTSAFAITRARELASQEGLENLTFEVGSLCRSRLAPDLAHACVARQVLGRIDAPEEVVKEMVRVASPGGIVAVADDDEGLAVYDPEPHALAELRALLARRRLAMGGSKAAGRSLFRLLFGAGLEGVRVVVSTANSTDPEWSQTRDPAGWLAELSKVVRDLVDENAATPEEAARYGRAVQELLKNPQSFVCVSRLVAYGRRPLRCA